MIRLLNLKQVAKHEWSYKRCNWFKPDAIIKLVDLMKRNPKIGASCGRIHPTGSGFMQWYQMFEYAIGHWLQKSTEHILGRCQAMYALKYYGQNNFPS